jgi:predicted small lipoprotein YifL
MTKRPTTNAPFSKPVLAILVALLAAGSLAACGKRGPLDPPSVAKAEGETKSSEAADAGENSAAPKKPHEPFILDGLLR